MFAEYITDFIVDDESDKLKFNGRIIKRVSVIIHGYMGDHDNDWILKLIKALFAWVNVIKSVKLITSNLLIKVLC